MHSEHLTASTEQVSQDALEAICKLTLSGSSPEAISLALELDVQTVIQVIAKGDFGSKDLDQAWNQCKQAQLSQEAMLKAQSENTHASALN
jgi:S-adenosylmethionine synthetase